MALRRIYCRSSAKRIPKRKRNSSKNSFLSWNVETRRSKDLLCWDTNKVRFIYVINYSESRFIIFLQLICIYSLKKYRKWEDTMVVWAKKLGKVFMTTWVETRKILPLQPVPEGITKSKIISKVLIFEFWSNIFIFRFLLPYERHTKGQEEKHIKRRESESGSEKVMNPERAHSCIDAHKNEVQERDVKSDRYRSISYDCTQ